MKKLLLLCLVAFSFVAADAQTRKSKKQRKGPNKEAIANARFNKQETQKKLFRDSVIIKLRIEDSTRLAMDSIGNLQTDSMSVAYKENGLRAIDSMNNESYTAIGKNTDQWDKTQKTHNDMIQAARLSNYKSRQVKIINMSYCEKAKDIIQDDDASKKVKELVALNEERRARIKALLGKAKEKKLEKDRKAFIKKNGIDADTAWMDMADSFAKK
jgi:hypothetical protein